MLLTIWRHGSAKEGDNDRLRELTTAGRDDVALGSRRFHAICKRRDIQLFTTILHSPWLRTTQTTEIIASRFSSAIVHPESALQPGSNLAAVDAVVSRFSEADGAPQHVALVSHQPLVSRLVDYYLGASDVPPLPPGGLVTISLDIAGPACGNLAFWAFPPEYEVGM